MKKQFVYLSAVILVLLIVVLSYVLINKEDYKEIDQNQISEILGVENLRLPDWEVLKAKQYVDGFTSPLIQIEYVNGIEVKISNSKIGLNQVPVANKKIGSNKVNIYKDNNETIYLLGNQIYYYFRISDQNQIPLVEDFILNNLH
ncbi:hypothetical protein ACFSL6_21800 [Paenibacillus thailandensis]|uniref:DUF4367 domain-containing protein n=1 Tax=Paenibacillus thailandensis TaxID=393250 RepID=A0ABW5R4N9_9BACL